MPRRIAADFAQEFRKFCEETEKELWQLFRSIDRDNSGRLDKSELSSAFERAGVAVSNARLDRFFEYIDKDRDGLIDYDEWRGRLRSPSCTLTHLLMRVTDFLLFIPTNTPGLQAVFSYYQTASKLTSEGDVILSDEAIQGLGTTLSFLKNSLFGAITQLVRPTTAYTQPLAGAAATVPDVSQAPELAYADYPGNDDEQLIVEDDPHIPLKPARRKERESLRLTDFVPDVGYFIAGGVSGITSRTATAPLDRLKVYLIAQTGNATEAVQAAKQGAAVQASRQGLQTLVNACKELWAAGGIRSLFAGECLNIEGRCGEHADHDLTGNGINVVKVMPESAVKFGSYEASKRAVAKAEGHDDPKRISSVSQFIAGGVAGMISQAVVYPLDTLKFRMQCETVAGGEHGNKLIIHTAQKMWRANGVLAFYRGLPMGLLGMFPYASIDLFMFETLKRKMIARNMRLKGVKHEEDALPGNFTLALMGGFSGAIGASAVYPLNLLRTRLQSQGTVGHPRTYTGIVDVTKQTLKYEGVKGLFKGLTPNLLKVVPAVSIVSTLGFPGVMV